VRRKRRLRRKQGNPSPHDRGEPVESIADLKIRIFADGADKRGMLEMYRNPLIKGFTTNPTLFRKAGVSDYQEFALEMLQAIPDRPISFEVLSDEFEEMEAQARKIAGWAKNVFVKIPITNTKRESSAKLIGRLSRAGVKLNVTAILALDQVWEAAQALNPAVPAYISVFAGRIADTGRDPVPLMAAAVEMLSPFPRFDLIWASPRELLNIFQADSIGCPIITVTNDILKKLDLAGRDLHEFSLETVKMFREDAVKAKYAL
jgi:transaldolase